MTKIVLTVAAVAGIVAATGLANSIYAENGSTATSGAIVVADTAQATPAAPDAKVEKKEEAGKWVLPDGTPTYNIESEKKGEYTIIKMVDWYTYSGWRRYHANCHECHGPSGGGSTFAPALADSLKTMSYTDFLRIVSSGQRREVAGTHFIMPAFGDNPNVMCFIDDLYIYLKARADEAMPAGLLNADQRVAKPKEAIEYEKSCLP